MKLITYIRDGNARLGAVDGKRVVDLNDADSSIPNNLVDALERFEDLTIAARAAMERGGTSLPLVGCHLAPAAPRPGKILCLGLNFVDHAKEGGLAAPDHPSVFMRGASSLVGHEQPVVRPHVSDKFDFEAELAVIVGRRARYVSRARALEHVFGYACFNDISVRDYQMRSPTWTVGKNFDATGAFGPWIVTADELPPGAAGLQIQLRLNGVVEQNANTSDMIVDVPAAIEYLSEAMTLEPGDVIAMGTPSGIGGARRPPLWLKPGDQVEVEIDRVGVLRNLIIDEVRTGAPATLVGAN